MVDDIGKTILVVGSKGGVGATTFVANLANELSREGDVLVVDSDEECRGDAAVALGCSDEVRTFSEVCDHISLTNHLFTGYMNTGVSNVGLLEIAPDDDFAALYGKLVSAYCWLVIDAGASSGARCEKFYAFSNGLVIVSGADHSSISASRRRLNLFGRLGANDSMVYVVVNKWDDTKGFVREAISEKIGRRIDAFLPMVDDCSIAGGRLAPAIHELSAAIISAPSFNARPFGCSLLRMAKPATSDDTSRDNIKKYVLEKLYQSKDVKKLVSHSGPSQRDTHILKEKIRRVVVRFLDDSAHPLPYDRESFVSEMVNETIGLGPLEKFMSDPDITEIMVNSVKEIYIEKGGMISKTDERISSEKCIMGLIDRIVAPIGRRVDEASPIVDARLADGSRVHVIIPPLALDGPVITIRKFKENILSANDLISNGSMSPEMAAFLGKCIIKRKNILVSGGTGSGKTTMLNVLSSFIPEGERIITIEDSAELRLRQPHVVRLEARPPNIEGGGEVTIRDLVKASLRMRPDRIIVGECRGAEALDMLQAMNTGHDGSVTTIHANSSRDSLSRLETLVLFAGFDLPVRAIREQIVSAIDVVVHMKRLKCGSRKVVEISEVVGLEGQTITMQILYSFKNGNFETSGFRPRFDDNDV